VDASSSENLYTAWRGVTSRNDLLRGCCSTVDGIARQQIYIDKNSGPLFIFLRSHMPYCANSLILAAVCSADFSNVLSA
jgi:hypothetical protein